MINNINEFKKAQEELKILEGRLDRLRRDYPLGQKGLTKAGFHKMVARLHEELAFFDGSGESQ